MFWDRRKNERREAEKTPKAERRGEGDGEERRKWTCGILYKTSLPVAKIEEWLTDNAGEKWEVGLESIDESLESKILKIMFENQTDKAAFIAAFSRRR